MRKITFICNGLHGTLWNLYPEYFFSFFRQPAENFLGWDIYNSFTAFLKEEVTCFPGNIGEKPPHSTTIYICMPMHGVWR